MQQAHRWRQGVQAPSRTQRGVPMKMLTRMYGRAKHALWGKGSHKGKLCPCCYDHRLTPSEVRRTQRRRERQEWRRGE